MTRVAAVIGIVLRPLQLLLVGLIRAYQRFVSPMLGPRCRYYPSCSTYALHSVQGHGPVKGFLLSAWRLLRCNPFSKGGYDPVPPRGRWLPDVHPDGSPRNPVASSAAKEG